MKSYRYSRVFACGIALGLTLLAGEAQAYVGPGAGFAFITSFFLLLSTFALALLAMLSWPVRLVLQLVRRRRLPLRPRARRVLVLGLDGLDPATTKKLMRQGKLPNLQRLAGLGGFGPLATTLPAMSPVAWSSFATGVDPSRHGMFDFLARDRRSYAVKLSSTEIRPPRRQLRLGPLTLPLGKARTRLLQRSVPFWHLLGRHGVPASVLRVPITFPPRKFRGTLLSAMCVPDLLGTQGSFSFYTSRAGGGERIGGRVYEVQPGADGQVRATLFGPPNPLRADRRTLELPLTLTPEPQRGRARLQVGRKKLTLKPGEYSDWVQLEFPLLGWIKLRGICRFRLAGLDPLELYVTPINIDPASPGMPLSFPLSFSVFLAKLIGPYATLGLAEDTWALNERVIDKQAFWDQMQLYHDERERMLTQMLRRIRRGLCVCVFDGTDRVQHMFMRDHRAGEGQHAGAIERIYVECDQLLGRLMRELDPEDPKNLLLVMSDHGFAPFERGVNLNTWLQQQGYLVLQEGRQRPGDFLEGVDWERTRAFAVGLAGLYVNQQGREAQGIVPPGEAAALRAEIAAGLKAIQDPEGGRKRPVRRVFDVHRVYDGPYLEDAPDLVVGYNRGYRASWETARGSAGEQVLEDNQRHWSGDHCIDPQQVPGVLFSNQPLDRGRGPRMVDLAPTVLEALGVAPPAHMTGRSLLKKEQA